jgi:hypothetical protein
VPLEAFQSRFGPIDDQLGKKMSDLLQGFLHEAPEDKKRKEPVVSHS